MRTVTANHKFGRWISFTTAVLTLVTLVIAVLTPPLSGPLCEFGCFQYPYSDIASRFPRDYYWMFPAMILVLFYLTMNISVHHTVPDHKKHFSMLSVAFSLMATFILFANYFVQVSVIQPSLLAGETDGIALLSQYNPHGIFIALEEIGFIFMGISFLLYFPIFTGPTSNEKAIKWVVAVGVLLLMASLLLICVMYGINREYRFEIAVISIVWIELAVLGFLLTRYFRNFGNQA